MLDVSPSTTESPTQPLAGNNGPDGNSHPFQHSFVGEGAPVSAIPFSTTLRADENADGAAPTSLNTQEPSTDATSECDVHGDAVIDSRGHGTECCSIMEEDEEEEDDGAVSSRAVSAC
jgi:hypothetical protein